MITKNLEEVQQIEISTEYGIPMVSSLQMAEHFGKPHNEVLKSIRKIIDECPEDFRLGNFSQSSYINEQSKEQPCFNLTRDAFSLVAMGFTGKKAFAWKVKYIEAFNALEQEVVANLRTFERIRQFVELPGKLDPTTGQIKLVSCIRGLLAKWAIADNIPVNIAERILCAFLEIKSLDSLSMDDFQKGSKFLTNQCMILDNSGKSVTDDQRTIIKYLVEACPAFRCSREFDALEYIKTAYGVTDEELENLTEHGASKLIMTLSEIMTYMHSKTHTHIFIRDKLDEIHKEELCETKKL